MIIKQIGSYRGDILDTILENRGITDRKLFLHPLNFDKETHFSVFNNMRPAALEFLGYMETEVKIGIIVDSDCDGMCSATLIYSLIKKLNPQADVEFFFHKKKTHGITEDILTDIQVTGVEYLIITDAGSNDVEEVKILNESGVNVLIIDHHEVEEGIETHQYSTLINNQCQEEGNHSLVGAGMVYKFIQCVDSILDTCYHKSLIDLVAIGQVADVSDFTEPEIRKLVFKGLQNIKNSFFSTILVNKYNMRDYCPNDIVFGISPLINAVIRVGSMEDKILIFEAMNEIDNHRTFTVEKKKKNRVTGKFDKVLVQMNLQEYAFDLATRCKTSQDTMVKKLMKELEEGLYVGGIIVGIDSGEDKGLSGLVANKLMDKYKRPALVLRIQDNNLVGSVRGYEKTIGDFKTWLQNTNLFNYVHGHANAAGCSIPVENLTVLQHMSDELESIKTEHTYEVDVKLTEVDTKIVSDIDRVKHIFGGKVHEPVIGYEKLSINKKLIKQKNSTINFYEGGMNFVYFGFDGDVDVQLSMIKGDRVHVSFVGKVGYNEWGGKKTPQMIVRDFKIEEEKKTVSIYDLVF